MFGWYETKKNKRLREEIRRLKKRLKKSKRRVSGLRGDVVRLDVLVRQARDDTKSMKAEADRWEDRFFELDRQRQQAVPTDEGHQSVALRRLAEELLGSDDEVGEGPLSVGGFAQRMDEIFGDGFRPPTSLNERKERVEEEEEVEPDEEPTE